MVSDETFFAWLDGELDAAEASLVEAEVAADPRLSALAAEHRQMQATLKGAFDTVVDAPLADHLLAAARTSPAQVIDFAEARKRREPAVRPPVRQWAAMAATLAVGVLIGTLAPHARQASPVEVQGGKMYAAAALDDALSKDLASAPHGDVRIGVTTISSGKDGYETPTGVFTILEKDRDHRSRTYDDAPMPFQQRLTWKGVALHAGNLPGFPASHGCIRLPLEFAKKLFEVTPMGGIFVRLHGRVEGWRAAIVVLAALILYSLAR